MFLKVCGKNINPIADHRPTEGMADGMLMGIFAVGLELVGRRRARPHAADIGQGRDRLAEVFALTGDVRAQVAGGFRQRRFQPEQHHARHAIVPTTASDFQGRSNFIVVDLRIGGSSIWKTINFVGYKY